MQLTALQVNSGRLDVTVLSNPPLHRISSDSRDSHPSCFTRTSFCMVRTVDVVEAYESATRVLRIFFSGFATEEL